jgi:transposase InsO family protein
MNGQGQLHNIVNIRERPAEAEDRAVPGHWEGDLIFGKGMSAVATLVERKSRFLMLIALPQGHRAELVADALSAKIGELPDQLKRSLTWDQGKEMAQHARFTIATGVPVYFCDPRSPWQRGSNENTNGLLRQYFAKRSDLKPFSQADLDAVAAELNDRPRQTLGSSHHHKHSTPRCDDPLSPRPFGAVLRVAEPRRRSVRVECRTDKGGADHDDSDPDRSQHWELCRSRPRETDDDSESFIRVRTPNCLLDCSDSKVDN